MSNGNLEEIILNIREKWLVKELFRVAKKHSLSIVSISGIDAVMVSNFMTPGGE